MNANYQTILEIIGVAYGCMRCGVAFGLPVSRDWSMDEFFYLVSAIGKSTHQKIAKKEVFAMESLPNRFSKKPR